MSTPKLVRFSLCLVAASLLFSASPRAEDVSDVVLKLSKEGRYADARQALIQQTPASRKDSRYYYNLGTLHMQLNEPGLARAYLELAKQLNTSDNQTQSSDLLNNLRMATKSLANTQGADRLDPASNSLEVLGERLNSEEAQGSLALAALIALTLCLRIYLKTRSLRATFCSPTGVAIALILTLVVSLVGTQKYASLNPPAFALEKQTVRSGPGEQFLELSQLEPGMRIRVTGHGGSNDSWAQIRYTPEKFGWVPSSSLLLLP